MLQTLKPFAKRSREQTRGSFLSTRSDLRHNPFRKDRGAIEPAITFDEVAPSHAARSGAWGRWGCEEHAEICYRSRACGVHVKNIGWRRSVMYAVIRSYSGKGTKALFDLLEKNKGEVESLIRGVKGFVSYSLVRTTRGGFSVSVYEDKAGADEST